MSVVSVCSSQWLPWYGIICVWVLLFARLEIILLAKCYDLSCKHYNLIPHYQKTFSILYLHAYKVTSNHDPCFWNLWCKQKWWIKTWGKSEILPKLSNLAGSRWISLQKVPICIQAGLYLFSHLMKMPEHAWHVSYLPYLTNICNINVVTVGFLPNPNP